MHSRLALLILLAVFVSLANVGYAAEELNAYHVGNLAGQDIRLWARASGIRHDQIQYFALNWEIWKDGSKLAGNNKVCAITAASLTDGVDCTRLFTASETANWGGAALKSWADLTKTDGTKLRAPPINQYQDPIRPASGGGSLTASPSSITMSVGETKTVTISGGTPTYSLTPSNNIGLTYSWSRNTLSITAPSNAGTTTLTIKDSSSPQHILEILVTVTAATSGDTTCRSQGGRGCEIVKQGINKGVIYIKLASCTSANAPNVQCAKTGPAVKGCQSCHPNVENGGWCYSGSTAYCAFHGGQGDCINGYRVVTDPSECIGVPGDETASSASASGDTQCTDAEGTCVNIPSGASVGAYFSQGLCSGPLLRQCKFDSPSVKGCQSCVADGDGTWCYTSNNGQAYCAGPASSCFLNSGFSAASAATDCQNILGDENSATAPGGGQPSMQVIPSTPLANTQFTIKFILPSPLASNAIIRYQVSGQSFTSQIAPGSCVVPNECTGAVSGMPAGTYTVSASIVVNGGAQTVLSLSPNSFTVGSASSGTSTNVNQCCVTSTDADKRDYHPGTSQDDCTGLGGIFYPTSCSNAQGTVCANYCRSKQFTSGGSCDFASPNAAPNTEFPNVCQTNACKCNTNTNQNQNNPYNQNQYQQNVPCENACLTSNYGSYYGGYVNSGYSAQTASIPIGRCTDNPQAFFIATGIATTTGTSGTNIQRQPYLAYPSGPGLHGCSPYEQCWCTIVDLSTFNANANARPTTLPGTGTAPLWEAPDDISKSAPQRLPNEHDCTVASNATISAFFTSATKLVQAGDTVTINGQVTKISDTCLGYNYTCRTQKILPCDEHHRVLWTSLGYQDCPAGMTQVPGSAQGEGRTANWRLIAAVGITVATWGAGSGTIALAIHSAAIASSVGAAVDGVTCNTPSQGAGANIANTIYALSQRSNQQNFCAAYIDQLTCRTRGCLWGTNGQCNAASIPGGGLSSIDCNACKSSEKLWCVDKDNFAHCADSVVGCDSGDSIAQSCSGTSGGTGAFGCNSGETCKAAGCNSAETFTGVNCYDGIANNDGYCCKPSGQTGTTGFPDASCSAGELCYLGIGGCSDQTSSSISCSNSAGLCCKSGASSADARCIAACQNNAHDFGRCESINSGFNFAGNGEIGCSTTTRCNCYSQSQPNPTPSPAPTPSPSFPTSYKTTFSPDPPIVNTRTVIDVDVIKAYDSVNIIFTTSTPTETIGPIAMDPVSGQLGKWSTVFTFPKNKLYNYAVSATTVSGHIDRLGGGTLNVILSPTGSATAKPTFTVTGEADVPAGTGRAPQDYRTATSALANPSSAGGNAARTASGTNGLLAGYATSVGLSYVPACPSAADVQGCFSVCGKTYNAPVAAAPVCNGAVIKATPATYKCTQGVCGGYENKKVKVQVRGPDGSVAVEDSTTTGGDGSFSYSFVAPAADGQFTVILSVPKEEI